MILPRIFSCTSWDDDTGAVYLSPLHNVLRLRSEVRDGVAYSSSVFAETFFGDGDYGFITTYPLFDQEVSS